jgi:uncharacterized pyridoxal phosphate-containing UPF0001 family protein
MHIAKEETKFGLDENELKGLINNLTQLRNSGKAIGVRIAGCMGMASLTDNTEIIRQEFTRLHSLFEWIKQALPSDHPDTLSMGMTSDYQIAAECGSTMVRIGSLLFGARTRPEK